MRKFIAVAALAVVAALASACDPLGTPEPAPPSLIEATFEVVTPEPTP